MGQGRSGANWMDRRVHITRSVPLPKTQLRQTEIRSNARFSFRLEVAFLLKVEATGTIDLKRRPAEFTLTEEKTLEFAQAL